MSYNPYEAAQQQPAQQNLFDDDDDEQEYNPNASAPATDPVAANPYPQVDQQQQQQQQPAYPEQPEAAAAPVGYNPYEQAAAQQPPAAAPQQQQQNLFEDEDEEEAEYVPQQVAQPPAAANPYEQPNGGMPVGFGSERANLMGEQAVTMPTDETAAATNAGASDAEPSRASVSLAARADNAKTKLLSEIMQFNQDKATVEQQQETPVVQEPTKADLFMVKDPVQVNKVTKYTVTGVDSKGEFHIQRRYNEFEALHKALLDRWPGVYIPNIPEKTAISVDVSNISYQSNKDAEFVENRRALLEKFVKGLSNFDYLIESVEFQIFVHGAGEVKSQLDNLDTMRPAEILERFKLNFSIDEQMEGSEVLAYKEKINVFQQFLNRAYVQLQRQTDLFRRYAVNYNESHKHYKKIYLNLMSYEDLGLDSYSEGDRTKRVLSHPIAQDLPQKITDNIEQWQNPFHDAFIWIKGEMLDVKAMMNAMKGREKQTENMHKAEQKKRDKQAELDSMQMGKKTLKSFFKSKNTIAKDIDSYGHAIEQLKVDTENYEKLANFITILQGQLTIDKFKAQKAENFYRMMNQFSVKEVSNAHLQAVLSHSILEMQEKM